MLQLRLTLIPMIMLVLCSCGGGGQQVLPDGTDGTTPVAQNPDSQTENTDSPDSAAGDEANRETNTSLEEILGLPKPRTITQSPTLKAGCYCLGSQYAEDMPQARVNVVDDSLSFDFTDAEEDDLAYAVFVINMEKHANTENPSVYLDWQEMYLDLLGDIQVGLADFESNTWQWEETRATGLDADIKTEVEIGLPGSSPFIREGKLVAVVVATAREVNLGNTYLLEIVSAGGYRPLTELYTPLGTTGGMDDQYGYASQPWTLTASGFLASEPCEYLWKMGKAARPSETSANGPVEVTLGQVGIYPVSVVIGNPYGPSLELNFTMHVYDFRPNSWAKVWPEAKYEIITVAENGDVYMACMTHSNELGVGIMLTKIDEAGQLQWAREFHRAESFHDEIETSKARFGWSRENEYLTPLGDNGVLFSCRAAYYNRESGEYNDSAVTLMRVSPGGEMEWCRCWSRSAGTAYVTGVSPNGEIVVGSGGFLDSTRVTELSCFSADGEFRRGLHLSAGKIYFVPSTITLDNDSALYMSGGVGDDLIHNGIDTFYTSHTSSCKLLADGTVGYLSFFMFSYNSIPHLNYSKLLSDGSLFLAGNTDFVEESDVAFPQILIARLDAQGEPLFCRYLNHPHGSTLTSVALAEDNSLVLGGYAGSDSDYDGIADLMLAQCNAAGELLGASTFRQSTDCDRCYPTAGAAQGKLYISGYADSPIGAWEDQDLAFKDTDFTVREFECITSEFSAIEYPIELTVTSLTIDEGRERGPLVACRPDFN